MRRLVCAIAILAALALSASPAAAADEQKFEIRAGESVKTLLADAVGKPVTLLMASGQELSGTLAKVGDHAVQITRLAGRDFYDAVVLIERVDGVLVKVRAK